MGKVEFSNEQYEKLIKLVYLGNWLINAHRLPDESITDYEEVEEYIFSKAPEFGLDNLIQLIDDEIYPSQELEFDNQIQQWIEKNANENFWSELISRLATIKFAQRYSKDEISNMTQEEAFILITRIEENYSKEFQQNGLDSITVKMD